MSSLNAILILANKLCDAIARFNAQQALKKVEQRRKRVKNDPINEFENRFGSAANEQLGMRKAIDDKTVRTNSTAIDLDKKQ